jgi:Protein of unknown function (DUF1524)
MRHRYRRFLSAVTIALVLVLTGCTVAPVSGPRADPTELEQAWQRLGELTTTSSGSTRGYRRERFPHWHDIGPNCDVRDAVLRRDGVGIRTRGCDVVDGRWLSGYDNRILSDPADVDVDHLVPLANAWRSGADEWTETRRGDFANDLSRPQLVAVSASSNRAKGDQDPSQWKPPNRDLWCQYAQDWVEVKSYWRLSVTARERSALTDMLETCEWWIRV